MKSFFVQYDRKFGPFMVLPIPNGYLHLKRDVKIAKNDLCVSFDGTKYRFSTVPEDFVGKTCESESVICAIRSKSSRSSDLENCYPDGSIYCTNFYFDFIEVIETGNPAYEQYYKDVKLKVDLQ